MGTVRYEIPAGFCWTKLVNTGKKVKQRINHQTCKVSLFQLLISTWYNNIVINKTWWNVVISYPKCRLFHGTSVSMGSVQVASFLSGSCDGGCAGGRGQGDFSRIGNEHLLSGWNMLKPWFHNGFNHIWNSRFGMILKMTCRYGQMVSPATRNFIRKRHDHPRRARQENWSSQGWAIVTFTIQVSGDKTSMGDQ